MTKKATSKAVRPKATEKVPVPNEVLTVQLLGEINKKLGILVKSLENNNG